MALWPVAVETLDEVDSVAGGGRCCCVSPIYARKRAQTRHQSDVLSAGGLAARCRQDAGAPSTDNADRSSSKDLELFEQRLDVGKALLTIALQAAHDDVFESMGDRRPVLGRRPRVLVHLALDDLHDVAV